MEVDLSQSHLNRTWTSQGKFKLEWCQGYRDSSQIENRVRILELEKIRKIKDIEKKLQKHKQYVELKIHKHSRQQDVSRMNQNHHSKISTFYTYYQNDKRKREENIRQIKAELRKSKVKQFEETKKQSQSLAKKIIQQKNQDIEIKIQKRNKVRLMEIQAKENIIAAWSRRMNQMKEDRRKLLDKKIKEHEYNLSSISKMQKKQRKILKEILDTEKMEVELSSVIENQSSMNGYELSVLYNHN